MAQLLSHLLLSFIGIVLSRDCSLLSQDYLKLVSKQDEVIVKDIQDIFSNVQYNDVLQLEDQNGNFKLIPSLNLIGTQEITPIINTLIDVQVQKTKYSQWINKFFILTTNQDNQYELLQNVGFQQGNQGRVPTFEILSTLEETLNTIYHGFAIVDQNQIIIDSTFDDGQQQNNYFYLIDQSTVDITKTKIQNVYPYDKSQKRIIKGSGNYIYRGTTQSPTNPSILEVFLFDKENTLIQPIKTFDQEYFDQYVVNITDYKFELKDFKVQQGDTQSIAILDSIGNLFIIDYSSEDSTWKFSWRIFQSGESYSFDYDFNRWYYSILQPNQILSNVYSSKSIEVDRDLSLYNIHISEGNLFISSSTEFIQFSKLLNIKYQINGDFSNVLTDYNYNDFLQFNLNTINHYQAIGDINTFYQLSFQNNQQTEGTAYLSLNNCKVTINYKTIEQDSIQLIPVSKNSITDFPLYSDEGAQSFDFNWLVDGPKQSVSFQLKSNTLSSGVLSQISVEGDLIAKDENTIFSANTVFFKSYSYIISLDQPYTIVTQDSDKIVKIYYCQQKEQTQVCETPFSFQIPILLKENNYVYEYRFGVYYLILLESQTKLTLIKIENSQKYEYSVEIPNEYQVDQLYESYINLILYSTQLKTAYLYGFDNLQEYNQITSQKLESLGISNWNPTSLFPSSFDSLIYVLNNENEVIILDFSYNVLRVVNIQTINVAKDTQIIHFYYRYAILQQFDDNSIQMLVYNQQIETDIYKEKTISFYQYPIQSLNQFYFASYNNVFYVQTKRPSDQADIILSYFIDATSHNALHSVIQIAGYTKYITCNQMYLICAGENKSLVSYINNKPTIKALVTFTDNTFVTDVQYIINYSNEMILEVEQTFRLANLYTQVAIDQTKFINEIELDKNQKSYDIGNDWYSGEVSTFSIQSASETIIVNPLELINANFSNTGIAAADLDKNYVFILNAKSYDIVSKETNQVKKSYEINDDFICTNILGSLDSQFLLQCTYQNTQEVILGVVCNEIECQTGKSWLDTSEDINSAQIESDVIFFIYRQEVKVYQNNILDLQSALYYGNEDFSTLDNFQYAIQVQKLYNQHYHIYCTNYNKYMIIQEFNIVDDQFTKGQVFTIDLLTLINKNYYVESKSSFSYIHLINIEWTGTIFKADYILFQTDGPHYGIHFEFTCNQNQCQTPQYSIVFVLQGYGRYQIYNYLFPLIKQKEGYIVIPYSDSGRTKLKVCVYELPKTQSMQSAALFFGTIERDYYNYRQALQCELYFYDNQPYLVTNAYSSQSIALYKITSSPQLFFNENQKSETAEITISNDYSSAKISVKIISPNDPIPPNPDPDSDDPSHLVLWLVLGGVAIAGVGIGLGYMYCKRKQRKVDSLL